MMPTLFSPPPPAIISAIILLSGLLKATTQAMVGVGGTVQAPLRPRQTSLHKRNAVRVSGEGGTSVTVGTALRPRQVAVHGPTLVTHCVARSQEGGL